MNEGAERLEKALPLPAYTAAQLGKERAQLAEALRQRLWSSATLRWPAWIDARPGRLGAIVGDCLDPPLGQTRRYLLRQHGSLLIEGLGALGLALGAPRLALCLSDRALVHELSAKLAQTQVEVCLAPASFPPQPARALTHLVGVPWVVPAESLLGVAALLRKLTPKALYSVVGALRNPQVLEFEKGETPRDLVRRAGGALAAAWVALRRDPLHGELWSADEPLPEATSTLYILPADHPLIRRQRASLKQRAQHSCLGCRLCTDFCPEAVHGTAPHRILAALGRGQLGKAELDSARGCTGCGACSVICPAELLPSALVAPLAAAHPQTIDDQAPPPPPASHLPLTLVLRRLDLLRYADPSMPEHFV